MNGCYSAIRSRERKLSLKEDHDPNVVGEADHELEETDRQLVRERKTVAILERFYADTLRDWGDSASRNIGTIDCCPPISSDVKGLEDDGIDRDVGFTEDWGTFVLLKERWKDTFRGNVLDLGAS